MSSFNNLIKILVTSQKIWTLYQISIHETQKTQLLKTQNINFIILVLYLMREWQSIPKIYVLAKRSWWKKSNGCYHLTYPACPILSFANASCSPKRTGWAANEYSTSFSPTTGNTHTLYYFKSLNKKLKQYSVCHFPYSNWYVKLK